MNATLERLATDNVRLSVRGIHLDVDAPAKALTPQLTAWLRSHKAELVEAVQLAGPCDRCGCESYVDSTIHKGASVRRDCAACHRTWGFPQWASTPAKTAEHLQTSSSPLNSAAG
jgi:hypothetical protein